jgi:hypothetical protein
MAGYIPTRLIPLLGVGTLEEIEEAHLERLIGLDEAADLEFKQEAYGNKGEQTRELACDIAGLANHVGGLLVIGVVDDGGRASALGPVDPDPFQEEEQLRIHKVVSSRIFPHPGTEVRRVDSASQQGKVFYVISIPPSEWAPHAVYADVPSMRWPRRDGTGRRWLYESEIADAYRQRHGAEEDQVDRAYDIHSAFVKELPTAEEGWLVLTLVPNRAGNMPISRSSVEKYQNWLNRGDDGSFPAHGRSWPRRYTRADYRSIRFADGHRPYNPAYSLQGRMYQDGSGVIAARYDADERRDFLEIVDEMLIGDVINCLLILGQHAVDRCFTGGDAIALAEFWSATGLSIILTGLGRDDRVEQLEGSIDVEVSTERSNHTVSLENVASAGPGLLLVARLILCDLMSPFGVPEPRQLSEDGRINLRSITPNFKSAMQGWAYTYGVQHGP